MKSWLPLAVEELKSGREVILIQSSRNNLAQAALAGRDGRPAAGEDLGEIYWPELAAGLAPGEPRSLTKDQTLLTAEILTPRDLPFWQEALQGQSQAWAAWLLTMVSRQQDTLAVVHHILAAEGPWTTPRLPPESGGQWFLLPLNAALGSLLIFGEDELALETAALGARAGLKVRLLTAGASDAELAKAQKIGRFDCRKFESWAGINETSLEELGLKPGVFVLVTCAGNQSFLPAVRRTPCGWLGLAGAAAEGHEPGLFPEALTPSQKALGLLAAMLGK
jgi:hypothetical protein